MIHLDPTKKHDAILLFDCLDGNPNGDPDAGNQPRIDPQTQQGLVTDACLKRKVRNYVSLVGSSQEQPERYKIFIEDGTALNDHIARAYTEKGLSPKGGKSTPEEQNIARDWMCENFYDVRMFGAVLSTGLKAGQVWGGTQMSFARSLDPVLLQSVTITRCAATEAKEGKDNKTMGRKEIIPYGLFKSHVFYNPALAQSVGVTSEDLALFWESLVKCWEFDRSASRGFMACRGLYIFTHSAKYGNAPAHKLFDLLEITSNSETPRSFSDYSVDLDDHLPEGVQITRL